MRFAASLFQRDIIQEPYAINSRYNQDSARATRHLSRSEGGLVDESDVIDHWVWHFLNMRSNDTFESDSISLAFTKGVARREESTAYEKRVLPAL